MTVKKDIMLMMDGFVGCFLIVEGKLKWKLMKFFSR